ncbi:MAG: sulfatase-like hydrolase/transferase, partial [Kiritimatiellae bacterium]|nr:sulfatase-like hydrolase/transferase [Kiritimatiellia bacterium]
MKKRPNILFLMSDEHRADVTGYEGNSVIRTPFLDWMAETGVSFSNAYTPSPICVPARQAIAAGQQCWNCKVHHYGQDLEPGYMTFARRFTEYAYNTIACGKLHHMGTDQMQGWSRRITMESQIDTPAYTEGAVMEEFKRYQSDDFPRKTHLSPGKWSMTKEILRSGIGQSPYTVWDDFATQGAHHIIDELLVSESYDSPSTRPLFLYLGLCNPHYPMFTTDQEKFTYYLNRVEPYRDQKTPVEDGFMMRPDNFWRGPIEVGENADVRERDVRRALAAYYANVEDNDERYQSVVDALEQAGEDIDDWILIYTSDHGDLLGEHNFWEKACFYEGSVRVPLIIRWPKGFEGGRVVSENVSLCDLFQTLCDLADIPAPPNLDSRSLRSMLEGTSTDWDNEALSQESGKHLMIKQDNLKYIAYDGFGEKLFDLATD